MCQIILIPLDMFSHSLLILSLWDNNIVPILWMNKITEAQKVQKFTQVQS